MVAAVIQITQGLNVGAPGEALIGVLGPFTLTSAENLGVINYLWEVLDVPPTSALPVGVFTGGAVPSITPGADVRGSYLFRLTTTDLAGNQATDTRAFAVLETTGRLIPPFLGTDQSMNFGGQTRGWAKYIEAYLHAVDAGGGGGGGRTFTFPGDADYTVLAADDIIEWSTLTAVRTATLPVAPTVGEEHTLKVNDLGVFFLFLDGGVIQIDRGGTPPFTLISLNTSYMSYTLVFNGTKWSLV